MKQNAGKCLNEVQLNHFPHDSDPEFFKKWKYTQNRGGCALSLSLRIHVKIIVGILRGKDFLNFLAWVWVGQHCMQFTKLFVRRHFVWWSAWCKRRQVVASELLSTQMTEINVVLCITLSRLCYTHFNVEKNLILGISVISHSIFTAFYPASLLCTCWQCTREFICWIGWVHLIQTFHGIDICLRESSLSKELMYSDISLRYMHLEYPATGNTPNYSETAMDNLFGDKGDGICLRNQCTHVWPVPVGLTLVSHDAYQQTADDLIFNLMSQKLCLVCWWSMPL